MLINSRRMLCGVTDDLLVCQMHGDWCVRNAHLIDRSSKWQQLAACLTKLRANEGLRLFDIRYSLQAAVFKRLATLTAGRPQDECTGLPVSPHPSGDRSLEAPAQKISSSSSKHATCLRRIPNLQEPSPEGQGRRRILTRPKMSPPYKRPGKSDTET